MHGYEELSDEFKNLVNIKYCYSLVHNARDIFNENYKIPDEDEYVFFEIAGPANSYHKGLDSLTKNIIRCLLQIALLYADDITKEAIYEEITTTYPDEKLPIREMFDSIYNDNKAYNIVNADLKGFKL